MGNKNSTSHVLSIVLLGENAVGKTCIVSKLEDDNFDCNSVETTIGGKFTSKTIQVKGKTCKLRIWDTGGNEVYDDYAIRLIPSADGIFMVYDITRLETLERMLKWLPRIAHHGKKNVELAVIGNQCDQDDRRKVPKQEVDTIMNKHGLRFLEVSAKQRTNLMEAIQELAKAIISQVSGSAKNFDELIVDIITLVKDLKERM